MAIEWKIWWIPQLPMKSFEQVMPDLETAQTVCDVLANYDDFQFKNNIKPDYCNAGGVMLKHAITDGDWWDWPDDEDERADLLAEMVKHDEVSA